MKGTVSIHSISRGDPRSPRRQQMALVLAGGAARGAYQAGVIWHLLVEVSRSLGRDVPLDVIVGTSAGAINALGLAALAAEPRARAEHVVRQWERLEPQEVLSPNWAALFGAAGGLLGRRGAPGPTGALINPAALRRTLGRAVPFAHIADNLRARRLAAVALTATHLRSGGTTLFAATAEPAAQPGEPSLRLRQADLGIDHLMASCAIPLLFPPVRLEGELYSDGGLRQNVPVLPARLLGADGMIVVSPHGPAPSIAPPPPAREPTGAFGLLAGTARGLLGDRIEGELHRLERHNALLAAACRRYGRRFLDEVNRDLGAGRGDRVRPVHALLLRPSIDLTDLAVAHVRAPAFRRRQRGPLGYALQALAERGAREPHATILSHLLFEGTFARALIAAGRADARARHDELCSFVDAFLPGAPPLAADPLKEVA